MKVNLSGVPETLFITLRVQAAETAKPNSCLLYTSDAADEL